MPRKLVVIAATGIALCVICIGAAAVVEAPRWTDKDWDKLGAAFGGLESCKPVPGATATTRQLDWTGEDRITIAVPGEVHYSPGSGETINASGDPDIIAHLRVHDHKLDLDCNGSFHHRNLQVTLPGRQFRRFAVAGSGKLDLEQLNQISLEMTVAGSGDIKASGKVDDVKINIAGSGSIEASGEAQTVRLKIAGSGDARLGQLTSKSADIDIAGSGNAEVAPQDSAKIKIAGSGDVRLLSDPKNVDSRIFGSGRIVRGAAQ
jgi:hypothetical protein